MKKYYIILLIIILVFSLFLTSCGKKKSATEGKTQIIFWHALGGPLGDALTTMVADFNKTHPDIEVKLISNGNYQALNQKLMASIQANQQPDISQAFETWTASLIKGKVIIPMSEFIQNDPEFKDKTLADFYPVFIKSNTFGDTLWSFPFNKSVRVMFYNKDMFVQNGLDPTHAPKDWNEFRTDCKKLTKTVKIGGKNVLVHGSNFNISAWQFENLLLQAGGEMVTPDGKKAAFNSKYGLEALQFISDLLNKDKSVYLSSGFDGQNDFTASKVGMYEGSSVSLAHMKGTKINFNMGFGPIPVNRTSRSVISGTNVVIFKKDDKKREQAAWEFVKWFTDTEQTAKWSALTNYMPLRKSAMQTTTMKDLLASNPQYVGVYAQLDNALSEPQSAAWFDTRKDLEENVLEKVIRQTTSPKKALDAAALKFDEKMKMEK
jgi:ABC-type glycerol-3-phosphate transport system substrate-binding protein